MSESVDGDRQVMLSISSACFINILLEPLRPQPQENMMTHKGQ